MSLKYKHLALIALVPLVSLLFYTFIIKSMAAADKRAYVVASSIRAAKVVGAGVRDRLEEVGEFNIRAINAYASSGNVFSPVAKSVFDSNSLFLGVAIYKNSSSKIAEYFDETKVARIKNKLLGNRSVLERVSQNKIPLLDLIDEESGVWGFYFLNGRLGDALSVIFYRDRVLAEQFAERGPYRNYLLEKNRELIVGPRDIDFSKESSLYQILANNFQSGDLEFTSQKGSAMLGGYYKLADKNYIVLTIQERKSALLIGDVIFSKGFLMIIFIIALSLVVGILALSNPVMILSKMAFALEDMARGNWGTLLSFKSNDELGNLVLAFNDLSKSGMQKLVATKEDNKRKVAPLVPKAVEDVIGLEEIKKETVKKAVEIVKDEEIIPPTPTQMGLRRPTVKLVAKERDEVVLLSGPEVVPRLPEVHKKEKKNFCINHLSHYDQIAQKLAGELNKKIAPLKFIGGEVEIKDIRHEKLLSLLLHAIRFSLFHGIEDPEDRLLAQKELGGHITIKVDIREEVKSGEEKKRFLEISVRDDGKGISAKSIRSLMEKIGLKNIIKNENDEEVIQHIFDNGFSSKSAIVDEQGKKVGMNAIRNMANELGGDAKIISAVGKGSMVVVRVPLM